ncbi:MAG: pyruvate ferredoxin oxidoreductase [archaeon]|nr:pyruvate ferredoxin oxidoreductase [archaeon]
MEDDNYPEAHKKILASIQTPAIGEAGKTGSWRTLRPLLDVEKCIVVKKGEHNCHLCWMFCPEAVITRDIPPTIDYAYCKGCGICATECPHKAIEMIKENGVDK